MMTLADAILNECRVQLHDALYRATFEAMCEQARKFRALLDPAPLEDQFVVVAEYVVTEWREAGLIA